jgi:hypothetical protein
MIVLNVPNIASDFRNIAGFFENIAHKIVYSKRVTSYVLKLQRPELLLKS